MCPTNYPSQVVTEKVPVLQGTLKSHSGHVQCSAQHPVGFNFQFYPIFNRLFPWCAFPLDPTGTAEPRCHYIPNPPILPHLWGVWGAVGFPSVTKCPMVAP